MKYKALWQQTKATTAQGRKSKLQGDVPDYWRYVV